MIVVTIVLWLLMAVAEAYKAFADRRDALHEHDSTAARYRTRVGIARLTCTALLLPLILAPWLFAFPLAVGVYLLTWAIPSWFADLTEIKPGRDTVQPAAADAP